MRRKRDASQIGCVVSWVLPLLDMKKLINDPARVVPEMLEGLVAATPGLRLLRGQGVVLRSDFEEVRQREVTLLSGGGSGHEPAHAGYVGPGMLTGAVAGEVFTSPSSASIYAAMKAVGGPAGILLIVKNYTGDRLNFGLAAERARADGIRVETVTVGDDVAIPPGQASAGPRGLAATVLVHKIAGASAAEGNGLRAVAEDAGRAAEAASTMSLSLSAGIVPAAGTASFVLAENEVELGLGIHGEPGVRRIALAPADALVDHLLEPILAARRAPAGSRVVLVVNNLGAVTPMELAIVARRALAALQERGLVVERVYSGTLLSSLEAAGVSLTVLPVDDRRLRLLDAPAQAPAWPRVCPERPSPLASRTVSVETAGLVWGERREPATAAGRMFETAVRRAARKLLGSEPELTKLDQAVGDGDLGISLSRGASAALAVLDRSAPDDAVGTLRALAGALAEAMGGSSGPLYGVFLLAGAAALAGGAHTPRNWAQAFEAGVGAISTLGGAGRGDRTMIDALLPAAEALKEAIAQQKPVEAAAEAMAAAARAGAEQTRQMRAKRGRSSYLGDRSLGTPDPGAAAAALWLDEVADAVAGR